MSDPHIATSFAALVGALLAPVAAVEFDLWRFRHMQIFHPRSGLPSFVILMALLFALATFAQTWELDRSVSGAIMPIAGITWIVWFRRRVLKHGS